VLAVQLAVADSRRGAWALHSLACRSFPATLPKTCFCPVRPRTKPLSLCSSDDQPMRPLPSGNICNRHGRPSSAPASSDVVRGPARSPAAASTGPGAVLEPPSGIIGSGCSRTQFARAVFRASQRRTFPFITATRDKRLSTVTRGGHSTCRGLYGPWGFPCRSTCGVDGSNSGAWWGLPRRASAPA